MNPHDEERPVLQCLAALFADYGDTLYDGSRREAVTALQHALQCAQLAEWAGAPPALVTAALLHDIGHFHEGLAADDRTDDGHELRALPWLGQHFGPAVTEPIRLHVAAKRYLVARDPGYREGLSPASIHSLALQGGPMSPAECAAFDAEPFGADALLLRRWDDAAKEPGRRTPSLAYYLVLAGEALPTDAPPRTAIAAFDAA